MIWQQLGALVWHPWQCDPWKLHASNIRWVAVLGYDASAADPYQNRAWWMGATQGSSGSYAAAGLRLVLWSNCRTDPVADALAANNLLREYHADGLLCDGEREITHSQGNFSYSAVFLDELRRRLKYSGPLGLSSYALADYHDADWVEWWCHGAHFLPQAYTAGEPGIASPEWNPRNCARGAVRPIYDSTRIGWRYRAVVNGTIAVGTLRPSDGAWPYSLATAAGTYGLDRRSRDLIDKPTGKPVGRLLGFFTAVHPTLGILSRDHDPAQWVESLREMRRVGFAYRGFSTYVDQPADADLAAFKAATDLYTL